MSDSSRQKVRTSGLSEALLTLEKNLQSQGVTIGDLVHSLSTQSHMLLALIFSLPFLLPVPLPGLSIVFGLIIATAGIAAALGKDPWLPKIIKQQLVSYKIMHALVIHGLKFAKFIERFVKPRGVFFVRHPGIKKANGVMIASCGLMLGLPFPPGTNFPPAFAIILLCLATLEEDVVTLFAGITMFILNIVFFGGLIFLGYEGIQLLISRYFT